jgi:hypothetical protein
MAEFDFPTVTIQGSQALDRADGRAAMVLLTKERGPIAFEVTLETIPLIRAELDKAEAILLRPVGRA